MTMKPRTSPSSAGLLPPSASTEIEEEAAKWLVRRKAGLKAGDEARLQAWLATDPQCRATLAELEAAWATISYPATAGPSNEAYLRLRTLRRTSTRRGIALGCLGLAAAAALVIAFVAPRASTNDSTSGSPVVAIRPDSQVLPDGSVIERNAGADVAIEFSRQARRVRLTRGEALFTVAHDQTRPFFVVAGGVEVRAVGTEFSVRFDPRQVDVLVTEGQVAVTPIGPLAPANSGASRLPSAPAGIEPIYVTAGSHMVVPRDLSPAVAPAIRLLSTEEIAAALAWRGKRIEFTRTPLSQVVELFNAENRLQLTLTESRTAELRITGLFWADDPEGFVRLLESGFNLRAERSGDVIRILPSP